MPKICHTRKKCKLHCQRTNYVVVVLILVIRKMACFNINYCSCKVPWKRIHILAICCFPSAWLPGEFRCKHNREEQTSFAKGNASNSGRCSKKNEKRRHCLLAFSPADRLMCLKWFLKQKENSFELKASIFLSLRQLLLLQDELRNC